MVESFQHISGRHNADGRVTSKNRTEETVARSIGDLSEPTGSDAQ